MSPPRFVTLVLLVASLALSGKATAGNNSSATAHLTWDREGQAASITRLRSLPFPVFLQLEGITDVRELAVHLEWMPLDTADCSYHILPAPVLSDTSSGWAAPVPTALAFDGDDSYTWRIFFPLERVRKRVAYWFTAVGCDTAPRGRFFLSDVRTRDSAGRIDRLRITGQATLRGGPLPTAAPELPSEPAVQVALPASALSASPNPSTFEISLQYALLNSSKGVIEVYDVAGRLTRRFDIDSQAGLATWRLDDASGSPVRGGLYFARLTTPSGSRTVRFVVLR